MEYEEKHKYGFWLGNNGAKVGGYSFEKGFVDFVPWRKVLQEAEKSHATQIILGGNWSSKGYRGYGETIHIEDAKKLL